MAKTNISGTGYSRSSSVGEKSAGRSGPSGSTRFVSPVSASKAGGGKSNAKKIVQRPSQTLGGNS